MGTNYQLNLISRTAMPNKRDSSDSINDLGEIGSGITIHNVFAWVGLLISTNTQEKVFSNLMYSALFQMKSLAETRRQLIVIAFTPTMLRYHFGFSDEVFGWNQFIKHAKELKIPVMDFNENLNRINYSEIFYMSGSSHYSALSYKKLSEQIYLALKKINEDK